MRSLCALPLALVLGACGADTPRSGEWEVISTMGSPSRPTSPNAKPRYTTRCVASERRPARDVILAMASRADCQSKAARIGHGRIDGAIHCSGMDDIPDHEQSISGTYDRDTLHMAVDMPLFGLVFRQTFDAKYVGACKKGATTIPRPVRTKPPLLRKAGPSP